MAPLFDAHNHLQDVRLSPYLDQIVSEMHRTGIKECVVNGTCEDDWPRVADLAKRYPDLIRPSFGLHPWKVLSRSPGWLDTLQSFLDRFEHAAIGECGLDRWIKDTDFGIQQDAFLAQLELARERDLPVSVHCLRAWGPLLDCLREHDLPARGFLLHSYGGPRELVSELADFGAYFSFSGAFLNPTRSKVRRAFKSMPADRILVETDAPDMLPPPAMRTHSLRPEDGGDLNHPANLAAILGGLAAILPGPEEEIRRQVARNYHHLFMNRDVEIR